MLNRNSDNRHLIVFLIPKGRLLNYHWVWYLLWIFWRYSLSWLNSKSAMRIYHKEMLIFVKRRFCIFWGDHNVFIFSLICYCGYYICWFLTLNQTCIFAHDYHFYIYWIQCANDFVQYFCIYIHKCECPKSFLFSWALCLALLTKLGYPHNVNWQICFFFP